MAKLRFRKTVSLPGGVKVTASTKGVGASIGVKGARIGRGADGKTRITGSIPGTGLSAQHTVGSGQRHAAPTSRSAAPAPGASSIPPAPPPRWLHAARILLIVLVVLFVLLLIFVSV